MADFPFRFARVCARRVGETRSLLGSNQWGTLLLFMYLLLMAAGQQQQERRVSVMQIAASGSAQEIDCSGEAGRYSACRNEEHELRLEET